jgi:hypothetical protein
MKLLRYGEPGAEKISCVLESTNSANSNHSSWATKPIRAAAESQRR